MQFYCGRIVVQYERTRSGVDQRFIALMQISTPAA